MKLREDLSDQFNAYKLTPEYNEVFTKKNPLVSIVMTAYNQGQHMIEYAMQSVLDQTHTNFELIIVADHSTDNTDELMKNVKDSRISYTNLPVRGVNGGYPGDTPQEQWNSTGTIPFNTALLKCNGDFLTHLDHDDYFYPDRLEKLIKFSQEMRADVVHHPFELGVKGDVISINESIKFYWGHVTTSSLFSHGWFKNVPGDINTYITYKRPGDWHRCVTMMEFGINIARYPESLTIKSLSEHDVKPKVVK